MNDNPNFLKLINPTTDTIAAVRPGMTLEVVLDENPTTGYLWEINRTPPEIKILASIFEINGSGVGAGGKRTITFMVNAEPLAPLIVTLKRRHQDRVIKIIIIEFDRLPVSER